MADGKWIDGLTPELPVAKAARLAVGNRLQAMRGLLDPLPKPPFADAEVVHQLRVVSRRTQTALDAFDSCLKKRDAKDVKAGLRAIRRAAGDVRDWDVFIQLLRGDRSTDFLLGYAVGQRAAREPRLADALSDAARLRKLGERLIDRIRPSSDDPTLRDLLKRFERRFTAFSEAAAVASFAPEEFHRLRIFGKRIRYSIELFARCFPPPLVERVYPAVEKLQQILGDRQDAGMAVDRLEALSRSLPAQLPAERESAQHEIERLLPGLREKLDDSDKRFIAWQAEWAAIIERNPLRTYSQAH